ncbi:hypothetical protein LJB81_04610, partial [Desulfovibrio sp. OttesenSCG-928-M14]|nr:hypothetical protein [Desulfovibrio sp. OttesenSCG-928-M14]
TSDPAPDGIAVKLYAQTQGGRSGTAQKLEVASGTVSGGQVVLTFSGESGSSLDNTAFLARKVVLYAVSGSDESAASNTITVGKIPTSDYLTGVSNTAMDWSNARSYCASHGGTLPLVNDDTSQSTTQVSGGTAKIDGIGVVDTALWNTPWPVVLPGGVYWTGTEVTGSPGRSWFVGAYGGGFVDVDTGGQGLVSGVVCVP